MNKNIEVLGDKIWAVDFHLIPYIPEIDYKPDPEFPAYEEIARITDCGCIILNKSHSGYEILKRIYPNLMKKSMKKLKANAKVLSYSKEPLDILLCSMVECEAERRQKSRKKVKPWLL